MVSLGTQPLSVRFYQSPEMKSIKPKDNSKTPIMITCGTPLSYCRSQSEGGALCREVPVAERFLCWGGLGYRDLPVVGKFPLQRDVHCREETVVRRCSL